MSNSKVYAVVLFEAAAEELGSLVALWLKRNDMGSYLYAKKIDPNGPYFHMVLENTTPDGTALEMEFQIPHGFIKAIFHAADRKSLGFLP
ncbi:MULTISPECIES: hypothetical protein [unclassified Duganella]|uniref:hypothetical protein n=1 Tax=unclassified Duganella TaxID=2636909 RepID=UPI00102A6234|nr:MULTISPECIES: hypothetical protein [unclassified Duganella]